MATQEKTWNVANRLHSQKDSDNPEVNHIIAGADEIYDDAKGAKQSDINAQTDASLADRYTKSETYSKEQLDSLITTPDVNYVSVVATNATTAVTDILPATGEANTIYRVGNWDGTQYDSTMYALYAWNGSAYVCLAVRSSVGEVYDVSVNHPDGQGNPTPYADLTAVLGTSGANIPADIRRGGMRIKFIKGTVQSSGNKYVQYRYTVESVASADFTNEANWELDVTKKNLSEDFLGLLSEIKDFTIKDYSIGANGKFGSSATYKHAVLSVNEGEVYYLIGQSSTCRVAFVTTDESSSGADVPVVSGTGIMLMGSTEQYYKFIIPQGCTHLIFNASGNYGTRCYKHYDSLKEGTDEYTDDKPTDGSNKLVKSGGIFKFGAGATLNATIIEYYKYESYVTSITKAGSTHFHFAIDGAGLYEISASAEINTIEGKATNTSGAASLKTYYPFEYNGKYYVYVTDADIDLGIVYLFKSDYSGGNVSAVNYYKTKANVIRDIVDSGSIPNDPKAGDVYIAKNNGVYTNFGGIEVFEEEICALKYDGTQWSKIVFGFSGCNLISFKSQNGYIDTNGVYQQGGNYNTTEKINVVVGDTLLCYGYIINTITRIAAYDANDVFIGELSSVGIGNKYERVRISNSNIKYVIITAVNSSASNYRGRIVAINYVNFNYRNVEGDIATLNAHAQSLHFDNVEFGNKVRISANGNESDNTNYRTTDLIPVNKGDKIIYSGNTSSSSYACIIGYGSDESFVKSLLVGATNPYVAKEIIIPAGISYIKASSNKSYTYSVVVYDFVDFIVNEISSKLSTIPEVRPKNIAVIGDSVSTGKKLNPYMKIITSDVGNEVSAYVTWRDVYADNEDTHPTNKTIGGVTLTPAMIGTLQTFTPVSDDVGKELGVAPSYYSDGAFKTWPELLCKKFNANLINASWSGASMCSGQSAQIYALSYAWSDYSIGRCKQRDADGNDIVPDVIIVCRGVNDMSHYMHGNYAQLDSDYDLGANGYPETDVFDTNKYGFYRAYYLTIKKLREQYPKAIIYCCTLNVFKRVIYDRFPTRNGLYTLPQMNDAIRSIANTMGCGIIEFDKDGITWENCYPTYISDSSTIPTHPNKIGHEVMSEKAFSDLRYLL